MSETVRLTAARGPEHSARRFDGIASSRDLVHFRDELERLRAVKAQRGIRLSPVEQHLLRTRGALGRNLYAPSAVAVAGAVLRACVKPVIIGGVYLSFLLALEGSTSTVFSLSNTAPGGAAAGTATGPGLELPVTNLVAALEASPVPPEPTAAQVASLSIFAPIPADLSIPKGESPKAKALEPERSIERTVVAPTPAPPAAIERAPASPELTAALARAPAPVTAAQTELLHNRGLVKFISGLIAAFRPSIPDSGLVARHIVEMSAKKKVDPLFVAAVISVESRFLSSARSSAGAVGLMQLMPSTAREVIRNKGLFGGRNALTDPQLNIDLGIDYLKDLEERYKGSRSLALSAYNWGPANVDDARRGYRRIPGSVRKYAQMIMQRWESWRRHFTSAKESAEALELVSTATDSSHS